MSTKLEQAIAAIKSGDKTTGRCLLAEVLKTNWYNEDAWMWLAETDVTDEERYKCFRNALKINPNNAAARHGMDTLQSKPATQKGLLKSKSPLSKPLNNGTKKCPYCAETIKAEALVCRFCGRDLEVGPQTGPSPQIVRQQTVPPQKKKRSPFVIVLIILAIILLCVCSLLSSQSPKTTSAPTPTGPTPTTGPTPIKADKIGAQIMCENFVKDRLKAPSTAKFLRDQEVYGITGKPKNYHIVIGSVDAQNAFGAMLRSQYRCELHYDINDPDRWYLDYIEIE